MAETYIKLPQAGGGSTAADVSYDNTASGLTATDVQAAIDELDTMLGPMTSIGQGAIPFLNVASNAFTYDRNNLCWDDSVNHLGIGLVSAECQLHIQRSAAGGEGPFIFLKNNAASTLGSKTGIAFGTENGSTFAGVREAEIVAENVFAGTGKTELIFSTWSGAGFGERLRVRSEGLQFPGPLIPTNGYVDISIDAAGADGGYIFLSNNSTSTLGSRAGIAFGTESGSTFAGNREAEIAAENVNAGNGETNLIFETWTGAAALEQMRIRTAGILVAGDVAAATVTPANGASGSFTTVDLKTVTVTNGIITSIV